MARHVSGESTRGMKQEVAEAGERPDVQPRWTCLWLLGCALVSGGIVYMATHWRSQGGLPLAIGFVVLPALLVLIVTGAVRTFDRKTMTLKCLLSGATLVAVGFAFSSLFDDAFRRDYVLDRHIQFRQLADQC